MSQQDINASSSLPQQMKTLSKLTAAPGITLSEVSVPALGHNDVLIRIERTAICGTDMHIYHWDDWAQRRFPYR